MRVAVATMEERVAPCLEYCSTITVYKVDGARVIECLPIPMRSTDPFDRVRLLRDQQVSVLICDGLQAAYETALRASGIRVIPWVSGSVEDVMTLFLAGRLAAEAVPARAPGRSTKIT